MRNPIANDLTPRDREILREVISTYVVTGEPVSSRRVAKQHAQGLSSATIRNIMADLEEFGYLTQPHTSAGRVPTPLGYHLFIDSLMTTESLSAEQQQRIDEHLDAEAGNGEHLATATSQILSELSQLVGVVLTPAVGQTALRHIELVPLESAKVLCVSVSTYGFVEHKVIETDELIPREELVRISNYLNDNFAGLTLAEIRDRLLALMDSERAQVDQLLGRAVALARQGLGPSLGPELVMDGAETLLTKPELGDLSRVKILFQTFSDRARLVTLLNRCLDSPGVRVFIGDESELTSELDFSLIVTGYGEDGHPPAGCLGILGPSRMDYPKIIPLVAYLGGRLSEALAAGRSRQ